MFIEDIIKANLDTIFPGYEVDSSYCIKISRDADILIDDAANTSEIIEQVKKKVKKRKIGAVCRFCIRPRHAPGLPRLSGRCLPHRPPGAGAGRQAPQHGGFAASAQSQPKRTSHQETPSP